jgi:hypothetical protein
MTLKLEFVLFWNFIVYQAQLRVEWSVSAFTLFQLANGTLALCL